MADYWRVKCIESVGKMGNWGHKLAPSVLSVAVLPASCSAASVFRSLPMSPPPYCTRVAPGCYTSDLPTLSREPRCYHNHGFAPPPPYDEHRGPPSYSSQIEDGLPSYSSLIRRPQRRSRQRDQRSFFRRNVFLVWLTAVLAPTIVFVVTLVIVLLAAE